MNDLRMGVSNQVNIRCSDEQRARWEECAEKERRKLTDWIRLRLDDAADEALGTGESAKGKRKG